MYNEKIESLISIALADGELSEKEKQILFQKAQDEGIDPEEFKKVLEKRLFETQKKQRINIKGKNSPSNDTKSSEEEHDWKYYQKKYAEEIQLHYEKQKRRKYPEDFEWKKIIPTTTQEAIGAMAFASMYLGDMNEKRGAQAALARIIQLCENDFLEDEQVQSVLPIYQNKLKQQEEKDASEKRDIEKENHLEVIIKGILWIVVLVLLVLQIIFWGWWTILTGLITIAVAGIIQLVVLD